jgi:hypothetical protein
MTVSLGVPLEKTINRKINAETARMLRLCERTVNLELAQARAILTVEGGIASAREVILQRADHATQHAVAARLINRFCRSD